MRHLLFIALVPLTVRAGAAPPEPSARIDDRPQVLIIGDSISLGYTPIVQKLMANRANVVHHPGNAQHTGTGLKKIDSWLGDTDWDVIHFNWGLWDLCYRHPESKVQGRRDKVRGTLTTALEQYERNLDQLVRRLKQTNAKLIWATTTVVPEGEAGRRRGDDLRYNEAAARVMKKHDVSVNDLNAVSRSVPAELFTKPGDVHLQPAGYGLLAEAVVEAVDEAIGRPAAAAPPRRILFGSCIKQDRAVPIFEPILQDQPEVFLFLGDNIYGDTEDMQVLRNKYSALKSKPGFQKLREQCEVLATWDDHDYGVNDGGADFAKREASERIFEEFWWGDRVLPSRQRPGIYDRFEFGPAGQRVQIILLDTRFFRSPLKRGAKRVGGSWVPDDDPAKTMLGESQWAWLERQLKRPAQLRIICSSIQFAAADAGQETWSNLPRERQRMLQLLKSTAADGVLFLSGDRHWSELSRIVDGTRYPLLDLTSSSLNQPHPRGTPTKNAFRLLPMTWHTENYGAINIRWEADPLMSLQIKDLNGAVQLQHDVRLSELSAK